MAVTDVPHHLAVGVHRGEWREVVGPEQPELESGGLEPNDPRCD
jgi:hypothetical protein